MRYAKLDKTRLAALAEQCAKLTDKDKKHEQAFAEEGLAEDFQTWPEY